ncbi:MAG: hypothetical protein LJE58_14745 [Thiogranum sp.]|jgi:uncharacterized protein YjgD (DUF1641 family)|nr:hypothetical protein [Thiogranum sp.]
MSQARKSATEAKATEEGLPSELVRLVDGAQDALTDDMVTRLSATLTDGLDLLDRINRSGVGDALPTLAAMVENGDLERVAGIARLVGSAQDAMTDDIVGRLAHTASGGLDLLDQVNRSGVAGALPALTALVNNGDLDRLVGLARLVGSAQDALSDDIVGRLALIAGEMMCLVDRLARNRSFLQMLDLLTREDIQSSLTGVLNALVTACEASAAQPPAKGGLVGLLAIARDADTQESLRFLSAFGRGLRNA